MLKTLSCSLCFCVVAAAQQLETTSNEVGTTIATNLIQELPYNGREALIRDGVAGAARFKDGLGRHGDFEKIR